MPTGATAAQTTLDPRTLDTSTFTSTPFTDEVKDKAHRKIDSIAEKAANAEAVLRQKAEQASETLELKESRVKEDFNQYVERSKQLMYDHPAATLGVAFGAGVILAHLMRK